MYFNWYRYLGKKSLKGSCSQNGRPWTSVGVGARIFGLHPGGWAGADAPATHPGAIRRARKFLKTPGLGRSQNAPTR